MPKMIDTSKVKWKYFELDEFGKVISSNRKPDGKNPLAIINTSLFFANQKSDTPIVMQQNVKTMLEHKLVDESRVGDKISIAVPYDDLNSMEEYYGIDNIRESLKRKYNNLEITDIEDFIFEKYEELKPYITLKMTNDLAKGNADYSPYLKDDRMAGSLPALESAQQLASAIESGYDVWSYGGGNTGHQTFEIAQRYFDENYDRLRNEGKLQKRVLFGGFSNGTTGSFALRGITNPFLSFTFGWQMASKRMAENIGDEELLQHRNCQIDAIVLGVAGIDAILPEREFKCDQETFFQIQERKRLYENKIGKECNVTNLACYAGQLVSASTGNLGQFSFDEMIILGLESFQDKSRGFEPNEALKRFLQSGKIDPNQILFIEIGDIIRSSSPTNSMSEMFDIPRKDGFIPNFDELRTEEKEAIKKLTIELSNELIKKGEIEEAIEITPQEYILYSNNRTREIIEDVKAIASEFQIPVTKEMGRNIGHGKYCSLVPTDFDELRFDADTLTIKQTPILTSSKTVEKSIPNFLLSSSRPIRLKEESELSESEIATKTQIAQQLDQDIQVFQIGGAKSEFANYKQAIIARSLELMDLNVEDVKNRDIAVYFPAEKGLIPGQEQFVTFLAFLAKNSDYQPKSITIISRFNNYEGRNYDADMKNRDDNYVLLLQDMLGENSPPIFMSHTSVDLDRFGDFFPTRHQLKLTNITPSANLQEPNAFLVTSEKNHSAVL